MKTLLSLITLLTVPVFAANHYVRAGGSGTGTDWTNACGDFTGSCAVSSLVRGDTYYVAGGTYAARAWNRAESGTNPITIRKATTADHGTDTGWTAAYGSGQAVFSGASSISTGYWDFNGVSEYGFKFDFSEGQDGVDISGASGVSLRYIDFDGITATGNYNYSAGTKCIVIGRGVTNLLVSHCALHGGESLMQEGDGNTTNGIDSTGTTVEYCHFYNERSISSNFHGNVYFATGSANGVFRCNRVENYNDEGLFFTGWEGGPTGWKVYGNVFWSTGGEQNPRGIEIRQDYSYSGIEIYNNTFVNLGVGGFLDRTAETGNSCTGCIATNNLSYNSPNENGNLRVSNNTADGTNRFVDLGGYDFRLTGSLAGSVLAAVYNTDMLGKIRGADGSWDQGAYEFGGSAAAQKPKAPTDLSATVQ
jgi:hypothetical protein